MRLCPNYSIAILCLPGLPGIKSHWDIDSATVSEMSGTCRRTSQDIDEHGNFSKAQDMVWFVVEKQATWDHKDIYSVASASLS